MVESVIPGGDGVLASHLDRMISIEVGAGLEFNRVLEDRGLLHEGQEVVGVMALFGEGGHDVISIGDMGEVKVRAILPIGARGIDTVKKVDDESDVLLFEFGLGIPIIREVIANLGGQRFGRSEDQIAG